MRQTRVHARHPIPVREVIAQAIHQLQQDDPTWRHNDVPRAIRKFHDERFSYGTQRYPAKPLSDAVQATGMNSSGAKCGLKKQRLERYFGPQSEIRAYLAFLKNKDYDKEESAATEKQGHNGNHDNEPEENTAMVVEETEEHVHHQSSTAADAVSYEKGAEDVASATLDLRHVAVNNNSVRFEQGSISTIVQEIRSLKTETQALYKAMSLQLQLMTTVLQEIAHNTYCLRR
jgi:hypothetical protein